MEKSVASSMFWKVAMLVTARIRSLFAMCPSCECLVVYLWENVTQYSANRRNINYTYDKGIKCAPFYIYPTRDGGRFNVVLDKKEGQHQRRLMNIVVPFEIGCGRVFSTQWWHLNIIELGHGCYIHSSITEVFRGGQEKTLRREAGICSMAALMRQHTAIAYEKAARLTS